MKNAIPQPLHTATAHRINKAWNEGNSAQGEIPATGEVTWNQNRFNQENWTVPGAEGSGDRVAFPGNSETLSRQPGAINHWNITPAFNQWIDGTKPNHGVLLRPEWSPAFPEFVHYSDDAPNGDDRPILRVVVDCVYVQPNNDEDIEFLGTDPGKADGIAFSKDPNSWVVGDTIEITWTLTTTKDWTYYGEGQFLRMWIDKDADCIFEPSDSVESPSNEEIPLKGLSNESYPYVVENTAEPPTPCVDTNISNLVDTYIAPQSDQIVQHTFTYKFTVPDVIGKTHTVVRFYLRYGLWPVDDPQQSLPAGSGSCSSIWGDVEDYEVTITSQ